MPKACSQARILRYCPKHLRSLLSTDHQEAIGIALRTKARVKSVYVSPEHLTDLASASAIMKHCVGKYRIPEPTHKAHLLVNQAWKWEITLGVKLY